MKRLKKILSGFNYLILYLFILILFDVSLQLLPLTRVFGFEYSIANASLIVFLSGIYCISSLKRISFEKDGTRKLFKQWLIAFALFLLIPAIISITNSLLTIVCSLSDGAAFYLVITFPSVIVGMFLALLAFSLSRKFSILIFILFYLALLSIPLLEFYFNPQIYFYNPIFGFFQGTIYDEALGVTNKLLIYRILNSIYFGTGSFLLLYSIIKSGSAAMQKGRRLKWITICICFLTGLAFYMLSPVFGFSTTNSSLNKELSGEAVTEHFIIHYPLQIDSTKVKTIILYHEYNYSELKKFFGFGLNEKINSYVFYNDKQKEKFFGSANADVAKIWRNEIFITTEDYDRSLKHETAHIFSGEFGSGILKLNATYNPVLVEGIAVAADPVFDDNPVHYLAALAYSNGYKINLNGLLSGFNFFTQSSTLSYFYAGSFTKFLIDEYGINKFKNFYRFGDFQRAYGRTLNRAGEDYFEFLKQMNIKNKDEAYFYFGRKSIFYKVCPRYTGKKLSEAWQAFNKNNFYKSKNIFKNILELSNDYSALTGYAACLEKLNRRDEAIKLLSGKINSFKGTAYFYNMELILADLYAKNENLPQADSIYNDLVEQNPSRRLFSLANLRLDLLRNTRLLISYLNGSDFDKYLILKNYNSSLLNYSYSSFPAMCNLSDALHESYDLFVKNFGKPIEAANYSSSYSIYKLSNFMLANLDYSNARKAAAMALRFSSDKNFDLLLAQNYEKTDWFFINHSYVFANTKFLIEN